MTLRRLAHLTATMALALTLAACGGSGGSEDSGESEASSETGSSSEEAPAESDATGEDYRALAEAVFENPPPEGADTVEKVNAQADYPAGISMEELDVENEIFCMQDVNVGIALRLDGTDDGSFELLEGTCEEGEIAAEIVEGENPDSDDLEEAISVEGDEDLAGPLITYLDENLG